LVRGSSIQAFLAFGSIADTKNLSAEHPEIATKLTKLLADSIANGRSTPGAKQANDVGIIIFKSNQAKAAKE
jgi:hypothetical protein